MGSFGDTAKAKVEAGAWKRVVISVKCCAKGQGNKGEMRTWVDAEPCVVIKDESMVEEGRFSIDPENGIFVFSSGKGTMMPGVQVRSNGKRQIFSVGVLKCRCCMALLVSIGQVFPYLTFSCLLSTVRCLLFTVHCSPSTLHCSLFAVYCPRFAVHSPGADTPRGANIRDGRDGAGEAGKGQGHLHVQRGAPPGAARGAEGALTAVPLPQAPPHMALRHPHRYEAKNRLYSSTYSSKFSVWREICLSTLRNDKFHRVPLRSEI